MIILKRIFSGVSVETDHKVDRISCPSTSKEIIVGRDRECDLRIASVEISRKHAKITKSDDGWSLVDLKSTNGICINDLKLTPNQSYPIKEKDVISFGPSDKTSLLFEFLTKFSPIVKAEAAGTSGLNVVNNGQMPGRSDRSCTRNVAKRRRKVPKNHSATTSQHDHQYAASNEQSVIEIDAETGKDIPPVKSNTPMKKIKNKWQAVANDSLVRKLERDITNREKEEEKLRKQVKDFERQSKENEEKVKKLQKELKEKNLQMKEIKNELKKSENRKNVLEDKKRKCETEKQVNPTKKSCSSCSTVNEGASCSSTQWQNKMKDFEQIVDTEMTCSVCQELFIYPVNLSCSHTFCFYCIELWKLKQKLIPNECPICRQPIRSQTKELVVQNIIDKVVGQMSPESQDQRKKLVEERESLMKTMPQASDTDSTSLDSFGMWNNSSDSSDSDSESFANNFNINVGWIHQLDTYPSDAYYSSDDSDDFYDYGDSNIDLVGDDDDDDIDGSSDFGGEDAGSDDVSEVSVSTDVDDDVNEDYGSALSDHSHDMYDSSSMSEDFMSVSAGGSDILSDSSDIRAD